MHIASLTKFLNTETFKDTSITTVGTLINGFLGALFYIMLARYLGPTEFGIISLSILILTLIVDVADLGLDTGVVRFVGKYKRTQPEKAKKFLKLAFTLYSFPIPVICPPKLLLMFTLVFMRRLLKMLKGSVKL